MNFLKFGVLVRYKVEIKQARRRMVTGGNNQLGHRGKHGWFYCFSVMAMTSTALVGLTCTIDIATQARILMLSGCSRRAESMREEHLICGVCRSAGEGYILFGKQNPEFTPSLVFRQLEDFFLEQVRQGGQIALGSSVRSRIVAPLTRVPQPSAIPACQIRVRHLPRYCTLIQGRFVFHYLQWLKITSIHSRSIEI